MTSFVFVLLSEHSMGHCFCSVFQRKNRVGSLATLPHRSLAHGSHSSGPEKLAVRLDGLQRKQRPDGWSLLAAEHVLLGTCALSPPGPGWPFFPSPEGVQSSFVSGRASSSNPKAWCPLGVILSCSRFLPAGGGSSPSTRPVSRAAVFTPQLPRSACANKQFLTLSYLCPNVWELHWDVYICLPEEPRK